MNNEAYEELLESVREAGAIQRGEVAPSRRTVVDVLDVKKLRERLKLTQKGFASALGLRVGTVRNWEQHRRAPDGAARVLLQIVEKHPDVLDDLTPPMDAKTKSPEAAP